MWGAIVRDERGWVDMVTIAADAGDCFVSSARRAPEPAGNGLKGGIVEMHDVLREESAQATVEYAIVTVALLSIVLRSRDFGVRHRWALGGAG